MIYMIVVLSAAFSPHLGLWWCWPWMRRAWSFIWDIVGVFFSVDRLEWLVEYFRFLCWVSLKIPILIGQGIDTSRLLPVALDKGPEPFGVVFEVISDDISNVSSLSWASRLLHFRLQFLVLVQSLAYCYMYVYNSPSLKTYWRIFSVLFSFLVGNNIRLNY